MTTIDELIKEFCPDGVEYKRLGGECKVLRGMRLTKELLSGGNCFPVFHGGIVPIGYYDKANRDANTVMVINVGASAGTIGFSNVPFWSSDGCFCLSHGDNLDSKYLYYALKKTEHKIRAKMRVAGIPTLDAATVNKLYIPIPRIEVQKEIVRILDSFTELISELEAELAARRKQYEQYRDKILTFGDDVERLKIKDVFHRLKGTPITADKMRKIARADGNVLIFAGGKTVVCANEADIPEANVINVPAVLVQSRGIIDFVYCDKPFTFKNEMWAYSADDIIEVKYLYHVLKKDVFHFRNA